MSEFKSSKISRLLSITKGISKAGVQLALDNTSTKIQFYLDQQQIELRKISHKVEVTKEIIKTMGELKGAMMKLGQMISISDDLFLPKEITELFKELQKYSPPMPQYDVEKVLQNSFQQSSKEMFLHFNPIPIASASIGQVHKAILKNGEIVAVKIQYPKIVQAINHDFQNLHQIDKLLKLLFPKKPNVDNLIQELKTSLEQECDYLHELEQLKFFKKEYEVLFPNIYIPKVYPEFSSSMVLTMEFVEGDSFDQTLHYGQEERNLLGQTLYDSFLHSLWNLKRLHTDPQNGNYLFTKNKIILLDFGSTREFENDFLNDYCALLISLEINSFTLYVNICKKLLIFKENEETDLMQQHFNLIKKLYLPYVQEGVFKVNLINPYELFKDLLEQIDFNGRQAPRNEFLLLDRSTFGLYTKLKAWNAEIDWQKGQNKFRNSIENEVKIKYSI